MAAAVRANTALLCELADNALEGSKHGPDMTEKIAAQAVVVIRSIVSCEECNGAVYAPAAAAAKLRLDVRFALLNQMKVVVPRMCGRRVVQGKAASGSDVQEMEDRVRNAYDFLCSFSGEVDMEEGAAVLGVAGSGGGTGGYKNESKKKRKRRQAAAAAATEEEKDSDGENEDGDNDVGSGKRHFVWLNSEVQRRCFTDAWLAMLQQSLPDDIYRKVLARLPEMVMPFMGQPVLLADFFIDAVNGRSSASLAHSSANDFCKCLALNGLFILMTRHGLEYPDFYIKLYSLLQPSTLYSAYRHRFLSLLDLFLMSPAVPGYMVAAFMKKLARLAVTACPSPVVLAVLVMVNNLVLRHPGMAMMTTGRKKKAASSKGRQQTDDGEEIVDCFDDTTTDPSRSKALQSTLWELESLTRHQSPPVSRLATTVLRKCRARAGSTKRVDDDLEIDLRDFVKASYDTAFEEEIGASRKRRRKKAGAIPIPAVAHYADGNAPSHLWSAIEGEDWSGFTLPVEPE